jgi:DNA-binding NarL/FixJ family response regulator
MRAPALSSGFAATALSPRELDVLKAYAMTGNQRLAAEVVGLSVQTVKNHLRSVYSKLGVSDGIGAFRAMGWLCIDKPKPQWDEV